MNSFFGSLFHIAPSTSSKAASRRAGCIALALATLSLSSLAITGCSATFVTPASLTSASEATAPSSSTAADISGSIYGGHAPIVNAKVYVLTPSTTTNAGLVTSLMKTVSSTTGGFPVTQDTSSGVTKGMYYVTSDGYGNFNLTGDYVCTPNQPVYIAAVGGSPVTANNSASSITSLAVGTTTGTKTAQTATLTLSTAAVELYFVGEVVTLTGFTGDLAYLNNTTQTVLATNLTTRTFAVTASTWNATKNIAGTYTELTATATANPPNNSAVVNMAALGICPSDGTFAGHLSFIFMNEISTAALAYATAAFGTDAFHIGVNQTGTLNTTTMPGYVTGSMVQAFNNAYLLYDIQGTDTSSSFAGEGHIARLTTPNKNGTTPQAKLDTIGNILAACVDSNNTASSTSPQCTTLFATATSDGSSSGTKPTDIAAAAFNIANFPAGTNNTSFANTLFTLPTGNVPFTPNLTTAPTDWTMAIQFTVTAKGSTTNLINNPQILAIDAGTTVGTESGLSGDNSSVWVGSYSAQPVKLFASGTPDYTANALDLDSATRSRSLAVDSSNNLWIMNEATTVLQHFSNAGALLTNVAAPTNPLTGDLFFNGTDAVIDATGNVYADYENVIFKRTAAGANITYQGGAANSAWSSNNTTLGALGTYTHNGVFDTLGNYYTINNGGTLCVANPTTAKCTYSVAGFTAGNATNAIYFAAMDGNNTLWTIPSSNATSTIVGYNFAKKSTGVSYTFTGGGLSTPVALAVDGAGNIWVANAGTGNFLSAFTPTGAALSPATGFGDVGNVNSVNSASVAIDRCGDLWVVYSGYNTVTEVIGIAVPTVSPTAFATFNGWLGKRPL
jgi:sugar lactone lactonase YvrE